MLLRFGLKLSQRRVRSEKVARSRRGYCFRKYEFSREIRRVLPAMKLHYHSLAERIHVLLHGFVRRADDVAFVHDDGFRLCKLAALQIGIVEKVHGVGLIVRFGLMRFSRVRASSL